MKSTKILATYGPSIASAEMINSLVSAGVNLFRINCSHGAAADFKEAAGIIRAGSRDCTYPVALLFDLGGPKLRLGSFEGEFEIEKGDHITLVPGKSDLSRKQINVNIPEIISSIKPGQEVFIDDGTKLFTTVECGPAGVTLKAENSGRLTSAKGINLPDTEITVPTVTEKDKEDLKTAVECDADYVGLSFVRKPEDITEVKKLIRELGGTQLVIAKLEKKEAIDNLEAIMDLADGVMVARGDLGVELPPHKLPVLQKRIIRLANLHRKPVIVATQMLESMRHSPRATRAEINDVAGAVFDFADAVMLSAETATGKYPLEAVKTMTAAIREVEKVACAPQTEPGKNYIKSEIPLAISEAVTLSTVRHSFRLICAFTSSGFTAHLFSNLFPPVPIIAITTDKNVMRYLSLYRSVYAVYAKQPRSLEETLGTVETICKKHKLAGAGDTVVITGGAPFGSTVPTNFVMYHEIKKS